MWIERIGKKNLFIQAVTSLRSQVLVVRGARQVGKTSFIIDSLKELGNHPIININLALKSENTVNGTKYFGRDFFGGDKYATQMLHNISLLAGNLDALKKPIIIFIDEADNYPISLESIQALAGMSDKMKVIFTGSNLENVKVKNPATEHRHYFDLYPISFRDFLNAYGKDRSLKYLSGASLKDKIFSEMHHNELINLFDIYLRLGGMPEILDTFLDPEYDTQSIPNLISDIVGTIEDDVKTVLEGKSKLYEYGDILRKIASLSMETLKFSKLQVQHAGRSEVKKLVNKTVGARVARKVLLYESRSDLSKYIIFDCGILNYLLSGSDLLRQTIRTDNMAIQYETAVGNEIIEQLPTRDDLFYWKSARGAQVEFLLTSPGQIAIDVKSTRGDVKSLNSCAVYENDLEYAVKISKELPRLEKNYSAKIPNQGLSRKITLITLPHYLSCRVQELCGELK